MALPGNFLGRFEEGQARYGAVLGDAGFEARRAPASRRKRRHGWRRQVAGPARKGETGVEPSLAGRRLLGARIRFNGTQ